MRFVSGAMIRAPTPERKSSQPSVEGLGYLSAINPPKYAPILIPANTTPMMLVQVYSETPTYGAMILPATNSITSVQKLAIKTTILALIISLFMVEFLLIQRWLP